MNRSAKRYVRLWALLLAAVMLLSFAGCASAAAPQSAVQTQPTWPVLDEDSSYTTAEDVCAYLLAYGRLPDNFITKKEAKALGWSSGSLEPYAPGMCLGGDSFGNREGLLPKAEGRTWTECDINTLGKSSRGDERLVFSNDGLIYYTGDRYKSFVFLASAETGAEEAALDEDGSYTTKEDVCAYLLQYGHLPANFITKREAEKLGWPGGSLEPYAPGMCIGGDRFGNYEGKLPKAKGRTWTECDINTLGKRSRGAERILFSSDGLIYYTGDHYESFELLAESPDPLRP